MDEAVARIHHGDAGDGPTPSTCSSPTRASRGASTDGRSRGTRTNRRSERPWSSGGTDTSLLACGRGLSCRTSTSPPPWPRSPGSRPRGRRVLLRLLFDGDGGFRPYALTEYRGLSRMEKPAADVLRDPRAAVQVRPVRDPRGGAVCARSRSARGAEPAREAAAQSAGQPGVRAAVAHRGRRVRVDADLGLGIGAPRASTGHRRPNERPPREAQVARSDSTGATSIANSDHVTRVGRAEHLAGRRRSTGRAGPSSWRTPGAGSSGGRRQGGRSREPSRSPRVPGLEHADPTVRGDAITVGVHRNHPCGVGIRRVRDDREPEVRRQPPAMSTHDRPASSERYTPPWNCMNRRSGRSGERSTWCTHRPSGCASASAAGIGARCPRCRSATWRRRLRCATRRRPRCGSFRGPRPRADRVDHQPTAAGLPLGARGFVPEGRFSVHVAPPSALEQGGRVDPGVEHVRLLAGHDHPHALDAGPGAVREPGAVGLLPLRRRRVVGAEDPRAELPVCDRQVRAGARVGSRIRRSRPGTPAGHQRTAAVAAEHEQPLARPGQQLHLLGSAGRGPTISTRSSARGASPRRAPRPRTRRRDGGCSRGRRGSTPQARVRGLERPQDLEHRRPPLAAPRPVRRRAR